MAIKAESIKSEDLRRTAASLRQQGYRFVTITCIRAGNQGAELLYHFDRELRLTHLRLTVAGDEQLPSLCTIYAAAFLVENEIQDHFGLRFAGLVPDYRRTLYLQGEEEGAPFRSQDKPDEGEGTCPGQ